MAWRVIVRPRRRRDPDVAALMAWVVEFLAPVLRECPVDVTVEISREP